MKDLRLTILDRDEINQKHRERAKELLDTFSRADNAGFEDLEELIAEGFQVIGNLERGLTVIRKIGRPARNNHTEEPNHATQADKERPPWKAASED